MKVHWFDFGYQCYAFSLALIRFTNEGGMVAVIDVMKSGLINVMEFLLCGDGNGPKQ